MIDFTTTKPSTFVLNAYSDTEWQDLLESQEMWSTVDRSPEPRSFAQVLNTNDPLWHFIASVVAPDGSQLCVEDDEGDGYRYENKERTIDIRITYDYVNAIVALTRALCRVHVADRAA